MISTELYKVLNKVYEKDGMLGVLFTIRLFLKDTEEVDVLKYITHKLNKEYKACICFSYCVDNCNGTCGCNYCRTMTNLLLDFRTQDF